MSSCEDEVLVIGKKLERMNDGSKSFEGADDLLDTLSGLPITLEVLTKTKIGMIINEMRRKTSDEKLSKRAKNLIKEWKSIVGEQQQQKPERKDKMPRTDSTNSNKSETSSSKPAPPPSPAAASVLTNVEHSSSFPPKYLAGDETRTKSCQLLLNALRYTTMPDGTHDPEEVAVKIEEKLFTVHKGTGDKYKAALRSRVFNLRDRKNPALRENVLTGVVKPEKFATMTSEEMASDEVRQMREKFNKEAIMEHQMSVQQGTPSEMFKCGKCGRKRCTYTQLQTRSSDEPMTTFVFCLDCGNRWKFC